MVPLGIEQLRHVKKACQCLLVALRTGLFYSALLFALLLGITSCAQLPEYARPKFYQDAGGLIGDETGFRYRRLTITDFQADALPPADRSHHGSINARSCLNIRPSNATKAQISKTFYYGSELYVGSFTTIDYEALFIPSCSWWNPKIPVERIDYVLQHEQIHFAIGELTARKVTRLVNEEMKAYTALGNSKADVTEALMNSLRETAHKVIESELSVHTRFDEDTSMFIDRDAQNEWFKKVTDELQPAPTEN